MLEDFSLEGMLEGSVTICDAVAMVHALRKRDGGLKKSESRIYLRKLVPHQKL